MKPITINVEKLDFNKPLRYYSELYSLSLNAIKNRFINLGVYDKFKFVGGNISKKLQLDKIIDYNSSPKKCPNCDKLIPYEQRRNKYCSYRCGALFSQRSGGHCKWSNEDKLRISKWAKQYAFRPNNKTRKNVERKNVECPICHNTFYKRPSQSNYCSRDCYYIHVRQSGCLKGKVGGYRKNSGRGKMGWYKGYWCQSSWELAWVIFMLDNNKKFIRNLQGFDYIFEGKVRKFFPDFYIQEEGYYIEIKGWPNPMTDSKIAQFPKEIRILYKKDMEFVLNYVKNKYGNDFIKLYNISSN